VQAAADFSHRTVQRVPRELHVVGHAHYTALQHLHGSSTDTERKANGVVVVVVVGGGGNSASLGAGAAASKVSVT
jgi:hypothetical protein